jgi:hypothetical protein
MKKSKGLVSQSSSQEGPRHLEDGGDNKPSEWGKGGKQFHAGTASEGSTGVSIPDSVSLKTGTHSCRY